MSKTEIFVWVKGYENEYLIGNHGTVVSTKFNKNKVLKQEKTNGGYLRVKLYKNKKYKRYLVHTLVAQAFIKNPKNKNEIDHIDGNPLNNNVDNLRWVTHEENMNNFNTLDKLHKKEYSAETRKKISDSLMNSGCIYKATNILTGEIILFKNLTELINSGFKQSCVSRCCNGKRKTHKGFKWEAIERKILEGEDKNGQND